MRLTLRMHLPGQFRLALVHVAAATAFGLSGCSAAPAREPAAVQPAVDPHVQEYKLHVLPVLQEHCLRCHGGMNRRGGLNMSTRANLLLGGKDGAVVLPGRPEDSLLIKVISPGLADDDPMRMPPKGQHLSAAQIATLRTWIADGAVMDH